MTFSLRKILIIFKFSIVGVINTLVSYIIFITLNYITQREFFSLSVAYIIAMLISYLLNKKFVFKANEKKVIEFVFINVAMLSLNSFMLFFLNKYFELDVEISQAVCVLVISVLNFFIYSHIFKKKQTPKIQEGL
ncbi:GtrA family protein [Vibrio fluvialis]|uniref:GtrA family protein n=1 Tax=Vibrio fluvialis TaxID=676 RepID=UPI000C21E462|nr:GtrA family protein [Vibrio fluvialis]MBL4271068.1 GtrA family protein [Vibrio fluvialis]MBL4275334.1 GtrA family protein [Vibrio fluvialis]MBO1442496.1 GtrA family protein [Vibrio fluvialis]MBO1446804.1 GtrA family protein [Vibrio fluvialis]